MNVSAILLAGGKGLRMLSHIPKQYIQMKGKSLAEHSFDLLLSSREIKEIIVVCSEERRGVFDRPYAEKRIDFALPGERRQDSLLHGLRETSIDADLICIHDASRPCISKNILQRIIYAGMRYGAAALGIPVKSVIKESDGKGFVKETLNKKPIWEVQTPQAAKPDLLHRGFAEIEKKNLSIIDDASIIELIGHPVKLIEGSNPNIEVVTPHDLEIVKNLLKKEEVFA